MQSCDFLHVDYAVGRRPAAEYVAETLVLIDDAPPELTLRSLDPKVARFPYAHHAGLLFRFLRPRSRNLGMHRVQRVFCDATGLSPRWSRQGMARPLAIAIHIQPLGTSAIVVVGITGVRTGRDVSRVSAHRTFQLPTSWLARRKPRWISVRRERPLQTTMLPGGGSLDRAR